MSNLGVVEFPSVCLLLPARGFKHEDIPIRIATGEELTVGRVSNTEHLSRWQKGVLSK